MPTPLVPQEQEEQEPEPESDPPSFYDNYIYNDYSDDDGQTGASAVQVAQIAKPYYLYNLLYNYCGYVLICVLVLFIVLYFSIRTHSISV